MDKCSLCTITRKRNPIIYDYNMRGKALIVRRLFTSFVSASNRASSSLLRRRSLAVVAVLLVESVVRVVAVVSVISVVPVHSS